MKRYGFLLLLLWPTPGLAQGLVDQGKQAFTAQGCAGCHAVTRPGADYSLADRVAEKGPNLWYAGSKYRPGWLAEWLEAPSRVSAIRHDTLAPDEHLDSHMAVEEAAPLAAFLMSLTDPQMPTGMIDTARPMSRMQKIQGRLLFGKEQQCFACHKTLTRYGVLVGGSSGPSFESAHARLNPDWIYAFLMDQTRYYPITRMPIYRGATYTDYTPNKLAFLARYIADMGRPRR